MSPYFFGAILVSTHSRPKAAANPLIGVLASDWFQHTAARRRLSPTVTADDTTDSFNTQPPEGGWAVLFKAISTP